MDVFIMWAGEKSHAVARDLKEFLRFVVQGPKYFISDDIEGGRLWRVALAGQLENSSFGIACLTADNLRSHWLHFEAGALSKAVGQANVVPFLVGATTTDVEGPLADFQMLSADELGTRKLVSLLTARVPGISPEVVEKSFGYEWSGLEKKLAQIRSSVSNAAEPVRSEAALIQEILDRVRRLETRTESSVAGPIKPADQARFDLDEEMVRIMKTRVIGLLDELTSKTTQTSMDTAIDRWRERLDASNLVAEELLDIYRNARAMEKYLNR